MVPIQKHHVDQWTEDQDIDNTVKTIWFSKKVPKKYTLGKRVSSTNGAGKTGYPH
jgi:hypothetical protein